jgi:hypothetical protein
MFPPETGASAQLNFLMKIAIHKKYMLNGREAQLYHFIDFVDNMVKQHTMHFSFQNPSLEQHH